MQGSKLLMHDFAFILFKANNDDSFCVCHYACMRVQVEDIKKYHHDVLMTV